MSKAPLATFDVELAEHNASRGLGETQTALSVMSLLSEDGVINPADGNDARVFAKDGLADKKDSDAVDQAQGFAASQHMFQLVLVLMYLCVDTGKVLSVQKATESRPSFTDQTLIVVQSGLSVVIGVIIAMYKDRADRKTGKPVKNRTGMCFNCAEIFPYFLPAACFTLSMTLQIVAIKLTDAATVKVVSMMRTMVAAGISVPLLGVSYTWNQWETMAILCTAVIAFSMAKDHIRMVLEEKNGVSAKIESMDNHQAHIGYVCVLATCFLSCFGSILCEKLMKENRRPFYVQKVQMELAGMVITVGLLWAMPFFTGSEGFWSCGYSTPTAKGVVDPLARDWLNKCTALAGKDFNPMSDDCVRMHDVMRTGMIEEACGQFPADMFGGFFHHWNEYTMVALFFTCSHGWCSGILVKALSTLVKNIAASCSFVLVFFLSAALKCVQKGTPFYIQPHMIALAAVVLQTSMHYSKLPKAPKKVAAGN